MGAGVLVACEERLKNDDSSQYFDFADDLRRGLVIDPQTARRLRKNIYRASLQ
jgi:hypothetical protein